MSPRRARLLLLVLLAAQLLLLTTEARDAAGSGRSVLERGLLRVLAPLGRLVGAAAGGARAVSEHFATQSALRAENRRLRREVVDLRRSQLRMEGLESEVEALSRAVAFAGAGDAPVALAEVIYADPDSWQRTILLRVGSGARLDQPVATDDGLVGRVIEVAGGTAKVQLLTDRAAAAAAQLERARRQGLVRGTAGAELELDFVPRQVEVAVGERVLSAGVDGVYPPGLVIGTVDSVSPGSEMFHRIRVRPAVDFSNLRWVYLLAPRAPGKSGAAGEGGGAPR